MIHSHVVTRDDVFAQTFVETDIDTLIIQSFLDMEEFHSTFSECGMWQAISGYPRMVAYGFVENDLTVSLWIEIVEKSIREKSATIEVRCHPRTFHFPRRIMLLSASPGQHNP